ncbi:MAG TPA: terminase family protein, partial [Vicinamibacterales bacterium]|nr:terminase family protein [Vicinamibacterales bacterium]
DALAVLYDWSLWARPNQIAPPGEWLVWLVLAGRGFGKTRTGAEFVRDRVQNGLAHRIALVSDTAADVRDVMIEGESGLLSICPEDFFPHYEPSKRRVTWPNGAVAVAYAAESPDMLRGPQHDLAWCDEPAKWKNLRKKDVEGGTAWDNLMMGLRMGPNPQCCATTTPRSIPWLTELMGKPSTVVSKGTSYENRVNLSPKWFHDVIRSYEGTRLGRQEINAEVLGDVEGALWTRSLIEENRVEKMPCEAVRTVVAIDPAVTAEEESDECGILTCALGTDGQGYVLADDSLRISPDGWARRAIRAYNEHDADRVIGEANNGGDLIETVLRTVERSVPYSKVHASKSKHTRAEPVSALYEQGKVHHVGSFPMLEDEMSTWVPGDKSPNRMDALVWALTALMIKKSQFKIVGLA